LQRDANDAAIGVAHELLQDRFSSDDVISGDFDLVGLDEQHGPAVEEKSPITQAAETPATPIALQKKTRR